MKDFDKEQANFKASNLASKFVVVMYFTRGDLISHIQLFRSEQLFSQPILNAWGRRFYVYNHGFLTFNSRLTSIVKLCQSTWRYALFDDKMCLFEVSFLNL